MLKSFVLLTLSLSLLGANSYGQTRLKIRSKGLAKDTCQLAYYVGKNKYVVSQEKEDGTRDNMPVIFDDKGVVNIETDITLEKGVYIFVARSGDYFEFLIDGEDLSFSFDSEDPFSSIKFEKSLNNTLFYDRLRYKSERVEKIKALQKENPSEKEVLEKIKLEKEMEEHLNKLMADHPEMMATQLFKMSEDIEVPNEIKDKNAKYYYYRNHFFDNFDFSQEWITRVPTYENRLMNYLTELIPYNSDSMITQVDRVLALSRENEEVYKFTMLSSFNYYAGSKDPKAEMVYYHMLTNYYLAGKTPWATPELLERLKKSKKQIEGYIIGATAQNFSWTEVRSGSHVQLYESEEADFTALIFETEKNRISEEYLHQMLALSSREDFTLNLYIIVTDGTKEYVKQRQDDVAIGEVCTLLGLESAIKRSYNLKSLPYPIVLDKNYTIISKFDTVDNVEAIIDAQLRD